jgi:hypothetical protein
MVVISRVLRVRSVAMEWYRIIKTVKGRRYYYRQKTWREGKRVRTKSEYLGPVDGDGKNYYHGTGSDFDEFDASKLGSYTNAEDALLGFHFTENKAVADLFGVKEKTKKVHLLLKRPFDLNDFLGSEDPEKHREFYSILTGEDAPEEGTEAWEDMQGVLLDGPAMNITQLKRELATPGVKDRLIQKGYDGIILPLHLSDIQMAHSAGIENLKGREYVVFNADQIVIVREPS